MVCLFLGPVVRYVSESAEPSSSRQRPSGMNPATARHQCEAKVGIPPLSANLTFYSPEPQSCNKRITFEVSDLRKASRRLQPAQFFKALQRTATKRMCIRKRGNSSRSHRTASPYVSLQTLRRKRRAIGKRSIRPPGRPLHAATHEKQITIAWQMR